MKKDPSVRRFKINQNRTLITIMVTSPRTEQTKPDLHSAGAGAGGVPSEYTVHT